MAWVVWSENNPIGQPLPEESFHRHLLWGTYTKIETHCGFYQDIHPGAIVQDADRPNLEGPKTIHPPIVPADDEDVYNHGNTTLENGADHLWDTSRQVRLNIINPSALDFVDPLAAFFGLGEEDSTTYVSYPNNDPCGNDDEGTDDEDNDPYSAINQGWLVGTDDPYYPFRASVGQGDDTFEVRVHFRSFARLQVGDAWYRISDWGLFRAHFRLKKEWTVEAAPDVNFDLDGDGDLNDVVCVWRNDGSSVAWDNAGF